MMIVMTWMMSACFAEELPPLTEDQHPVAMAATAGDEEPTADGCTPRFIDAQSYFQTPAEIDAWFELVRALRNDFDDVCGDTFCEGDFSNYESLRFRCSVDESTGVMGRCVWVFGASNEEIAPTTGAVSVQGEIFACDMPIAPDTRIADFVTALSDSGVEAIRAPLPGSDRSLYDGLADCL